MWRQRFGHSFHYFVPEMLSFVKYYFVYVKINGGSSLVPRLMYISINYIHVYAQICMHINKISLYPCVALYEVTDQVCSHFSSIVVD